MNITIFNEYHPNQKKGKAQKNYPEGIHSELKKIFAGPSYEVTIANQEDPYNGLTNEILNRTDVLIWWSDIWNDQILSDVAASVYDRVINGMSIIFLYGGYASKPFKQLMGAECNITKSTSATTCKIHTILPYHPIASQLKNPITFSDEKIYSEPFSIPNPNETIFIAGYSNSDILRTGFTFLRGKGRIFYFYGGSELGNSYLNPEIKKIIFNATNWTSQTNNPPCENLMEDFKGPENKKRRFFARR